MHAYKYILRTNVFEIVYGKGSLILFIVLWNLQIQIFLLILLQYVVLNVEKFCIKDEYKTNYSN